VRLGIVASGKGSNLRNLVELGFDVVAVATNRPDCGAAAFGRKRGIPLGEFPQKRYDSAIARDAAMTAWLLAVGVEVVVCAGYDRVLTSPLLEAFPGRILNIHPSLLPEFAGSMDAVGQALAAGVARTGCTVHLVTSAVDAGPVLLQATVPVEVGDSEATLHARIQIEERRILPEAIRLLESRLAAAGAPQR
jgi:phosphoribosylglycinamide formyltransferase-1